MPRRWVISLIVICIVLNGAGFAWKLFEPIPLYDEIAHFLTPFVLVAVVAEIIYRSGGDDEFFDTPRHRNGIGYRAAGRRRLGGRRVLYGPLGREHL